MYFDLEGGGSEEFHFGWGAGFNWLVFRFGYNYVWEGGEQMNILFLPLGSVILSTFDLWHFYDNAQVSFIMTTNAMVNAFLCIR